MVDEFLKQLGEMAVRFAYLEDELSRFIRTLCGTERARVFTRTMSFRLKCDRLEDLLKLKGGLESGDPEYAADVRAWIKECRAVARERNAALHSKHAVSREGWFQRFVGDGEHEKLIVIPIEQLVDISTRISDLIERGRDYQTGRTDLHRQFERDNAFFDYAQDHLRDYDERDPDDDE